MMHEDGKTGPSDKEDASKDDQDTRLPKPGETDTTRFGMEDGDNIEVPSTGVDPERQSDPAPERGKAP